MGQPSAREFVIFSETGELGRVKSSVPVEGSFIVFNPGEGWSKFMNYTGQLCYDHQIVVQRALTDHINELEDQLARAQTLVKRTSACLGLAYPGHYTSLLERSYPFDGWATDTVIVHITESEPVSKALLAVEEYFDDVDGTAARREETRKEVYARMKKRRHEGT